MAQYPREPGDKRWAPGESGDTKWVLDPRVIERLPPQKGGIFCLGQSPLTSSLCPENMALCFLSGTTLGISEGVAAEPQPIQQQVWHLIFTSCKYPIKTGSVLHSGNHRGGLRLLHMFLP